MINNQLIIPLLHLINKSISQMKIILETYTYHSLFLNQKSLDNILNSHSESNVLPTVSYPSICSLKASPIPKNYGLLFSSSS